MSDSARDDLIERIGRAIYGDESWEDCTPRQMIMVNLTAVVFADLLEAGADACAEGAPRECLLLASSADEIRDRLDKENSQ